MAAMLLLCAVVFLAAWFIFTPPPERPEIKLPPRTAPKVVKEAPHGPPPGPAFSTTHAHDRNAIDPDVQRLADELASRTQNPSRDLEIVNEFMHLYSKAFQGNPVGMNEDITASLTGRNPLRGVLFPPNSQMIVNGQIVDRWGTPYWFHSNSATQMEIRSAGPDKTLFTPDDIVINPGPDNMGIGVAQAR